MPSTALSDVNVAKAHGYSVCSQVNNVSGLWKLWKSALTRWPQTSENGAASTLRRGRNLTARAGLSGTRIANGPAAVDNTWRPPQRPAEVAVTDCLCGS